MSAARTPQQPLSREDRIQRMIALLDEALQIIDELGDPPTGARLQSIIDELKHKR